MKALNGMRMYHPAHEPLRIELVYEAGRKILPLDLADSNAIKARLPFVLVSNGNVHEVMPKGIIDNVDTTRIGIFDDNKHPRGNRHYTNEFINNVTIIKEKTHHEQDKEL